MLAQGGMTPMEALRSATINGAHYLGMEEHIGSLEVGKLADLVILGADPLADIQNTEQVQMVMVNGRLYNAATLNETGHREKPRGKFFWEVNPYGQNFPWHESTNSFQRVKCSCGQH
jgi:adenine deaminase